MVRMPYAVEIGLLSLIVLVQAGISSSESQPKVYPRIFYKKFTELTSENFDEKMKSSGFNGYLVFFGALWCGHSRQFNKTYNALAEKVYSGSFQRSPQLGYYNIHDPQFDSLHKLFRVKGFPSLIYVSEDEYWTFAGDRKLEYIEEWLTETFTEGLRREGTPFPRGELTVWDDLGEIWRDMKYSLRYNLATRPLATWIVIIMVSGSVGSVLFIFCILISDALWLSGSPTEDQDEIQTEPDKKEK